MASCALAFLLSWVSVLWSGEGTISLGLSYPLGTLLVHFFVDGFEEVTDLLSGPDYLKKASPKDIGLHLPQDLALVY